MTVIAIEVTTWTVAEDAAPPPLVPVAAPVLIPGTNPSRSGFLVPSSHPIHPHRWRATTNSECDTTAKELCEFTLLITYPEYSHYRPLWPTSNLSEGIRRLASQNAGTAFPSALSKVTPQGPIRSKGSEGFAAVYKDGLNQSSRLFEHFDIKHQAERTAINNVPDQYRKAPRAP